MSPRAARPGGREELDLRSPEVPQGPRPEAPEWGSDAVAEVLRGLKIEYMSLNPGASYRGLHDSVVNYLGNSSPQMLVCLHEEHAVGIAHGYAKVAGRPMAVGVHSNVGLMHASMAIFNAFCDRVPMLVVGATGPLDAAKRRPWIDWLHTAADQAALVRPFLKWDDQPGSVEAAVQSLARGYAISTTRPCGPVYLCLDAAIQEERLSEPAPLPSLERFRPASAPSADPDLIADLAGRLRNARNPVLLFGRGSRDEDAWRARTELAERLGARVFTHLKLPAAFPTSHPLHAAPPSTFPSPELCGALREADVILGLDWLDLGGTLERAAAGGQISGTIVSVSLDEVLHNGWGKEHFSPVPADVRVLSDPDVVVRQLLSAQLGPPVDGAGPPPPAPRVAPSANGHGPLTLADVAAALDAAAGEQEVTLIRVPTAWPGGLWAFRSPLDYLGADGGEGIGSGPGLAIGAALALAGTGRLPVAILGDGDFLMGAGALWTAARYGIPVLVVVANNRSYFNDEFHQQHVAAVRGRPVENRWIGQQLDDPPVDIAALARSQGALGFGPVTRQDELASALAMAVGEVRGGAAVVVDVRIAAEMPKIILGKD
jgi:thiamine pyrophosphate-dependent acetolactate synthase large subunit-like protein